MAADVIVSTVDCVSGNKLIGESPSSCLKAAVDTETFFSHRQIHWMDPPLIDKQIDKGLSAR